MKSRLEAVKLIQKQLDDTTHRPFGIFKEAHHYGVLELRELMDFIYEEPPTPEECIKRNW